MEKLNSYFNNIGIMMTDKIIETGLDSPHENLVIRANKLIESRHKMTMAERRFILWNIAQIDKQDTSFKPYEIGVREYFDVMGLKQISNPYEVVKKMHDRLTRRNIGIEYTDEKGKSAFSYYPWFSRLDYRNGKIYSLINLELKPFLLELKEQFTSIHLEQAMILDGYYAGRMYDLLAQYRMIGSRILTIDFIKDRFDLIGKYRYFKDFRKHVIDHSVNEINEKTDLEVSYELIKEGRKYTGFEFRIGQSKPTVTLKDNREEQSEKTKKIFNKLVRIGILTEKARSIISQYSDERICWHLDAYQKKKGAGEDISAGWLIKGIEVDYRPRKTQFDQALKVKKEHHEIHKQNKAEYERLKSVISDVERLKRISDLKTIETLYSQVSEAEKQRIETEFIKILAIDNADTAEDSDIGNWVIDDFRKNKWKSLACIAEMRQYWYQYGFSNFTDIADIAMENGIDYRKVIKKISELKQEISDYTKKEQDRKRT